MIDQRDLLKLALNKFNSFWFRRKDKFEYVRKKALVLTLSVSILRRYDDPSLCEKAEMTRTEDLK